MDLDFDDADPPAFAAVITYPDHVRSLLRWRSTLRVIGTSGTVTEYDTPSRVFPPDEQQRANAIATARAALARRFGVDFGSDVLQTWGGQNECTVWTHDDGFTLTMQHAVHGVHAVRLTQPAIVRVAPRAATFVVSTNGNRLVWFSLAKNETRYLDVDGTIVDISSDVRSVTVRRNDTDVELSLRKIRRNATPGLPDDLLERSPFTDAIDRRLDDHSSSDQEHSRLAWWWAAGQPDQDDP